MLFNTLNAQSLQRLAPSIFSEGSAERTSDKYQHISTIKLIDGLAAEGFVPVYAGQSRSRLESKRAFTKHIVRFRHQDARPTANGLYPEIVLINSHDGLSSYRLMSGVFRLVCSNGLIAGNSYEEVRVRHQGDIMRDVIEGTYQVIENSQKMLTVASEMSAIQLSNDEKQVFAETAHALRFEDSELGKAIAPRKLLQVRRSAEYEKHDIFTVFNIVQENLIKGGIRGLGKDSQGYAKRVSTREVKSIDQNTALNRALWTLTERMMELKSN